MALTFCLSLVYCAVLATFSIQESIFLLFRDFCRLRAVLGFDSFLFLRLGRRLTSIPKPPFPAFKHQSQPWLPPDIMSAEPQTVIIGVEVDHVVDLSKEIDVISDEAYDFIVAPLAHPLNERMLVNEDPDFVSQTLPFTRTDMIMPGQDWRAMVIGRVSNWIRPDSANERIRENAVKVCYL